MVATTQGIELADFGVAFTRAVTGGTGVFRAVAGQHEQTYVANEIVLDESDFLNASGGFNTSFEFHLLQARRHLPLRFFR